ncbi:MAG: oligosaccharide flippase family protein, partial [Gammaproteobacteria bacterium]|nr:oligosaccharide flippase family protein [Gammaproteobacteria bacterium]
MTLKTIRDTIGLLRFTAFETSTEEGRSQERHRHIAWTTVTAAAAKAAALAAMLISVPLTLSYLGPERFGLWMAITAVISMLGFADFGLSNGIMNAVSHASGRNDLRTIHQSVSNGFIMLAAIGLSILLLFVIAYRHVPWPAVFNVSSATAALESGRVVFVLVICFIATLPLGATQKIQLGLQQGYWGNLWEALGSVSGLLGIVVAIQLEAGLQWVALAMAGMPLVFRAVNTLVFFGFQETALRPHFRHFDFSVTRRLIRTGFLFFVLQLAVIVGFQSDNIIIARILGVEAVAAYDIALKLSTLPAMFIGLVVVAQWPAYGEALTRGDSDWIRRTFIRTIKLSLMFAVPFALVLLAWGDTLIRVWAGPEVVPSMALLVGMSIWSVLLVLGNVTAAL